MLFFITGNKDKFLEIKKELPEIEQLDVDLPEIQDIDPKAIIEAKLKAAFAHYKGEFIPLETGRPKAAVAVTASGRSLTGFIVEDTSFLLSCINGLPGPFAKWFLKALGREGVYNLCGKMGNYEAFGKTIIGFARSPQDIHFFEGSIKGTIVAPRAESGFGWDPIFVPDGHEKSFSEMSTEEKNGISHRGTALKKLLAFLQESTK